MAVKIEKDTIIGDVLDLAPERSRAAETYSCPGVTGGALPKRAAMA